MLIRKNRPLSGKLYNDIILLLAIFNILLDHFIVFEGLLGINIIKIISIVLLFLIFIKEHTVINNWRLISAYILFFLFFYIQTIILLPFSENIASSLYHNIIYLIKTLLLFFVLAINFSSWKFDIDNFMKWWIYLGVIFSLQTICFVLNEYVLGLQIFEMSIFMPRFEKVFYFNLFGIHGVPGSITRPSSFFSEATRLVQFIYTPFFITLISKSIIKYRKIALSIMFIAMLLTFSTVALVALFISLLVTYIIRIKNILIRIVLSIFIILSIFSMSYIYDLFTNIQSVENPIITNILDKKVSAEDKVNMINLGIEGANENPFGIGNIEKTASKYFGYQQEFNSASGVMIFLIYYGYIGAAVFMLLWLHIIYILYMTQNKIYTNYKYANYIIAIVISVLAMVLSSISHNIVNDRLFIVALALLISLYYKMTNTERI